MNVLLMAAHNWVGKLQVKTMRTVKAQPALLKAMEDFGYLKQFKVR